MPEKIPVVEAPATVVPAPVEKTRDQVAASDIAVQEESDRRAAGQRNINLIWENTQMKVALSVIWSSLAVSFFLSVFGKWLGTADMQLAAIVFLFGVANLVTGFYFGRTNHQKSGGVGGDSAGTR